MGYRRHADVNRIDLVEQGFESLEEANAAALGVSLSLLLICRVDADDLDVRAVNLSQCLVVKRGRKARAHNSRTNRFLLHR